MNLVDERAEKFAKYWWSVKPAEGEDGIYLILDAIEQELYADGLSFEDKLSVVKKGIGLILEQEPRTKQERFEAVWLNRNFFLKKGLSLNTGKEEIYWDSANLDSICKGEGVNKEEFLKWRIGQPLKENQV